MSTPKTQRNRLQELSVLMDNLKVHCDITHLVSLRSKTDKILNTYLNKQSNKLLSNNLVNNTEVVNVVGQSNNDTQIRPADNRRKNIIIHGLISENKSNPVIGLNQDVQNFLHNILQVDVEPLACHRIGLGPNKPVRLLLKNIDDKKKIFGNCHRLKNFNNQFWVTNDLSQEERKQQQFLQQVLNQAKASGQKVSIRNNKLYINSVPLVVNESTQSATTSASTPVPMPQSQPVISSFTPTPTWHNLQKAPATPIWKRMFPKHFKGGSM